MFCQKGDRVQAISSHRKLDKGRIVWLPLSEMEITWRWITEIA
jgi:hypothetical protein